MKDVGSICKQRNDFYQPAELRMLKSAQRILSLARGFHEQSSITLKRLFQAASQSLIRLTSSNIRALRNHDRMRLIDQRVPGEPIAKDIERPHEASAQQWH